MQLKHITTIKHISNKIFIYLHNFFFFFFFLRIEFQNSIQDCVFLLGKGPTKVFRINPGTISIALRCRFFSEKAQKKVLVSSL